ncbi:HHE domain-containing protein [Delphinella strobiligena]|nr:HHE domain-containing protein [Delphinella strobiligena]
MPQTISEAIGADHARFDVLYDNIKAEKDDAAKVRWRNELTWTVARHAISEELTLYPAMEKHLGEIGVELSKTDKEQHQGVKNQLAEIQDMSPLDSGFNEKLDNLMDLLHHHIEHEKEEDMPRLEKLLSREESEAIARSFERTKGIVPTRSHPAAPTEYYLETLAGLLAAPIDRFQDWFRDFPTEKDQKKAEERMAGKL